MCFKPTHLNMKPTMCFIRKIINPLKLKFSVNNEHCRYTKLRLKFKGGYHSFVLLIWEHAKLNLKFKIIY